MPQQWWSGEESLRIIRRIIVEGDLVLQTPAHFGNGDGDDLTDMPLLSDPLDSVPLLTGASLAGALRSYLRSRECGYNVPIPQPADAEALQAERHRMAVKLFGGVQADDQGEQSLLIVEDALGTNFDIEKRTGVFIKPESRTAADQKLFDVQLWQAGTTFRLRFELRMRQGDDDITLKQAMATALEGLTHGSITLGTRKRRGYGRVEVATWRVTQYDLTTPAGLLAWIAGERDDAGVELPPTQHGSDIFELLGVKPLPDARHVFTMTVTFALHGSLLIRSASGHSDQPDTVHLHSIHADNPVEAHDRPLPEPILPGTSLGGAMRARALKIAQTLSLTKGPGVVNAIFGTMTQASRISMQETRIEGEHTTSLVQHRIRIDRFTGGAYPTALFSAQPVFGDGHEPAIHMHITLQNPRDHEIGLLLLVLKDLWTGDLPLGGEASVGRGRLQGRQAFLEQRQQDDGLHWTLEQSDPDAPIVFGGTGTKAQLEAYVTALHTFLAVARN